MTKTAKFNFEQHLAKLEAIVEALENEELALEDALKNFENGITLTRECQQALQQAEQKVKILLEKHGQQELVAFEEETDSNDSD